MRLLYVPVFTFKEFFNTASISGSWNCFYFLLNAWATSRSGAFSPVVLLLGRYSRVKYFKDHRALFDFCCYRIREHGVDGDAVLA